MERFKKGCVYGSLGGCSLFIVESLYSSFPYLKVPGLLYECLLIIGIIISVFVLLYKKSSLTEMMLRFLAMIGTYMSIWMINAHIGAIRFVYEFFKLNTSSASDNASGLATLIFWIIIISVCIIAIVIESIRSVLNKK